MSKLRLSTLLAVLLVAVSVQGQNFTGMSGLINTPSADMNPEGDLRIGAYYLNRNFTPSKGYSGPFAFGGKKYDTFDFYLTITPFKWMEVGYTFTLMKGIPEGHTRPTFNQKDRYLSVKFQPLREGKYWPAVAIGTNDFIMSRNGVPGQGQKHHYNYFTNFYLAATKHFDLWKQDFGVNLAYRYCPNDYTRKWQGVVGGLTWRPSWVPFLRAIVEYTGNDINVGLDALLWKHLFLQVCLQDGRYFSGGICFSVNLF